MVWPFTYVASVYVQSFRILGGKRNVPIFVRKRSKLFSQRVLTTPAFFSTRKQRETVIVSNLSHGTNPNCRAEKSGDFVLNSYDTVQ